MPYNNPYKPTVGQGVQGFFEGFINRYLADRDLRRQQQFEMQQQTQRQQANMGYLQEQNRMALDRMEREYQLKAEAEKNKPEKEKPSLLDVESKLYSTLENAMPGAAPEAIRAVAAKWNGESRISDIVFELYPNGYPMKPEKATDARLYKTKQDANRDARTRFGEDYDEDSLQRISVNAFNTGSDVGEVETQLRPELTRSKSGRLKQRRMFRDEIEARNPDIDPGIREGALDLLEQYPEMQESEAVEVATNVKLAGDTLTNIGRNPDEKDQPLDVARINDVARRVLFVKGDLVSPENEPTIQDFIILAKQQGLDDRSIEKALTAYFQAPAQQVPLHEQSPLRVLTNPLRGVIGQSAPLTEEDKKRRLQRGGKAFR